VVPETEGGISMGGEGMYTGLMSTSHIFLKSSFNWISARYHEPVIMFSVNVVSMTLLA
jgi:hypothetical protein